MNPDRKPQAYALDRTIWYASIKRASGKTLDIAIPKAIVDELQLRPGMRCKFRILIGDNDE